MADTDTKHFCLECGSFNIREEVSHVVHHVRGREVRVENDRHMRCGDCNEVSYPGEMLGESMRTVVAQIRREDGLPTDDAVPHAAVWRILHEECGAREEMDDGFPIHWPKCREYRFGGRIGSGGKIWASALGDRWHVSCYPEHRTPKRDRMCERANARLAELHAEFRAKPHAT